MRRVLSALAAVVILGTVGYALIEGMAFEDAVLSTVSVMATVGLPEGLTSAGKIFTSALIVATVGLVVAAVARLVAKPEEEEELLTGFFSSGQGAMIMKEIKITKGSPLAGLSKARILQSYGLVVVGIKSRAGFDVDVPLKARARSGSSILLLGSPSALLGIERKGK